MRSHLESRVECPRRRYSGSNHLVVLPSHRMLLRASNYDDFAEAEDLESLQALFATYSDAQGLMTKEEVMQVPAVKSLMVSSQENYLLSPFPFHL